MSGYPPYQSYQPPGHGQPPGGPPTQQQSNGGPPGQMGPPGGQPFGPAGSGPFGRPPGQPGMPPPRPGFPSGPPGAPPPGVPQQNMQPPGMPLAGGPPQQGGVPGMPPPGPMPGMMRPQHMMAPPNVRPGMPPPGQMMRPPGAAPLMPYQMPPPGTPGAAYGAPPGPPGPAYGAPPGPPGPAYGAPPGPPGPAYGAPPGPPGPTYGAPPGPPGQPYGAPPGPHHAPPGGPNFEAYATQRMMEHFESLTIGGGMGPAGVDGIDGAELPRPVGEQMERAYAPPPPTSPANCNPDNMRMSVNAIPNSSAMRQRWALPVACIVRPMGDEAVGREVPVVNLGAAGIVRCKRCRTYVNPFMQWTDQGRKYKCNVCFLLNEVPVEYYNQIDHAGRRRDSEERPELSSGTVEFVAPQEYMVRPPMPPVYFFVIDVSAAAVSSGMVLAVCAAIKAALATLPGDERTLVGILTFDSTLHFYNLKPGQASAQMMVVAELDDPFVPLPDDLLVNLHESRSMLEALLDSLPGTFASSATVDSAMGPALQAAFLVMSHIGGKLMLFQAGVPSLAIGKVKNRGENLALYGTEREAVLRVPEDPFFKRFAAECSRVQITVDVFAFSRQFMDLASLAAIPRYTCGQVYYYPGFDSQRDGQRVHAEVVHNLGRTTAWEAVMRIRCSKGLRIASFHGHFFNRSTDLLALPTCDPDKAFAVEIMLEESVVQGPLAYVQCALLYTSSSGERRIRVHTLSVPVVTDLVDMYKAVDSGATATMLAKLAVEKSYSDKLEAVYQSTQQKLVQAFREFRSMHASQVRAPNKLVFPESLRMLPLWVLGACKSAALRPGPREVHADERIAVGHEVMGAPVDQLLRLSYPTLYTVGNPGGVWGTPDANGDIRLPPSMPLSMELVSPNEAYLMDNGRLLVLWVGASIHPNWIADVFGPDVAAVPNNDLSTVSPEPARANDMSRKLVALIQALRRGRPLWQQCFVVKQGSALQSHVVPYFVEDRTPTVPSYREFMLALHKGIMMK